MMACSVPKETFLAKLAAFKDCQGSIATTSLGGDIEELKLSQRLEKKGAIQFEALMHGAASNESFCTLVNSDELDAFLNAYTELMRATLSHGLKKRERKKQVPKKQ
ncbi:hypothetical protein PYCC9005_002636 [Savitreella phatthalungensis]